MGEARAEIRFSFGREDLLRTRFAISPLIELVAASYVLRQPRRYPEHRRWVESAGPGVENLDLSLVFAAAPLGRRAWPNFNAPPPLKPNPELEDELARIAATDPRTVAADVRRAYPDGVPAVARSFVAEPSVAVVRLVDQLRALWGAAIEPWWTRMSGFLEAEIAARARRVVARGGEAAFSDLGREVRWDGHALSVAGISTAPRDIDLDGRGLLLIPSVLAFGIWPRVDAPWDPALVYQPPGTGDLWGERDSGGNLQKLLGRRRAAILASLDQPASTHTIARRTGWSTGGVNTHLGILRGAGLVTRQRDGRTVLYSRTASGEALCAH